MLRQLYDVSEPFGVRYFFFTVVLRGFYDNVTEPFQSITLR